MYAVRKGRYILALLLVLCALSVLLPLCASADDGGYFTLFVTTRQNTIIEPTRVTYTDGQTVADALEASGYDFIFTDATRQFIESIKGESGNFVRFHDNKVGDNDYDLSVQADSISLLVFTEAENQDCDAVKSLVELMGDYNAPGNNVCNYDAAKSAYDNALQKLRTANESEAKTQYDTLKTAMDAYSAILGGTKQTVTFTVTQDGKSVSGATITMTDTYGNVTTTTGASTQVVAGEYTFDVTSGYNSVRGSVTVESGKNAAVTAELPSGEWFGTVRLSRRSLEDYDNAVYGYTTKNANEATYYIEDCTTLLYVYAEQGSVPDASATKLRTTYVKTSNGESTEDTTRGWKSKATSLSGCLEYGMVGRDIKLEARYTDEKTGYMQVQSYVLHLVRVPTLKSLTAAAPDGTLQVVSPAFDAFTTSYNVTSVFSSLTLSAEGYGDGYTITGTGAVTTSGNTTATIKVTASNGQSKSYTVTITKASAAAVTMSVPGGCTVEVYNSDGYRVAPKNGTANTYSLVPGNTYTYIATKNTYYHTKASFTASNNQTVAVAEPETTDAITGAKLHSLASVNNTSEFAPDTAFSSGTHTLRYVISDNISRVYAQATAISGYTVTAIYDGYNSNIREATGEIKETEIKNATGGSSATALSELLAKGGRPAEITMRASKTNDSTKVTYYQDYVMTLVRSVHLKGSTLTLTADGEALSLLDESGAVTKFESNTPEYWVDVANTAETLTVTASFAADDGGYSARIGDSTYTELSGAAVALDRDETEENIEIIVSHTADMSVPTTYTIHVKKKAPVKVTFSVTPTDANVFLINNNTGRYAYLDSDGSVQLPPGASYTYNVTCAGYVGQQVTEYTVPDEAATVTVALKAAPERTYTEQKEVWPTFRADKYNNGVVSTKTPTTAADAELYWATQLGEGYSSDACGCPILVGDYLYTYAKNYVYKLDTVTGQVVASGQMDHSSSFAINSPTYAEGMIFVGLSDGCVQAFDADTLESLWLYRDSRGGQPNSPIVYNNGYIYTGFWQGETTTASFVCLSVTDEDPANDMESKIATWQYAYLGGFYWAGAYVTDDYVLVTTDDGAAGYMTGHAKLLSLDPLTGRLIDSITLPHTGDARSSVVYNGGYAYFTTKGGYFYRASVGADGTLSGLDYIKLSNYSDSASTPAMSTCSPVIYNGRAYIGVAGTGQFVAYSGHNITVIDLGHWNIAYKVRTQGYPQTSGLLTTAYSETDGAVYVYFIDNFTPGKVRVLRDTPGQTAPDITTTESVVVNGQTVTYNDVAPVLFTPGGSQAQYAICSPIADEYGTMYFKNDSAYMMALGSKITELRVDKMPDKTVYYPGDTFDPAGMQVTAVYANGMTRDVTKYVTYSTEPLTAEDYSFTITFPHVKYQNTAAGEEGSANPLPKPTATITLTIGYDPGDVNSDKKINAEDAAMVAEHVRNAGTTEEGKFTLDSDGQARADVNNDGQIDMTDAELILKYSRGQITSFGAGEQQTGTETVIESASGS